MQFLRSIKSAKALALTAATAATMITASVAPTMAQTPTINNQIIGIPTGIPKNVIPIAVPEPNPSLFHLTNKGGYVARFEVNYTVNRKPFSLKTGDVTLGNRVTFSVPGNATDIRVSSFLFTGLFGETKQIFFKTFKTMPQNTCFTVFGATFASQYNQDCRL